MMLLAKIGFLLFYISQNGNFLTEAFISNFLPPQPHTASPRAYHSAAGLQFKHKEILNATTGSILEWEVDSQRDENSIITFTFSTSIDNLNGDGNTVILLGLSRTGQVEGSDVVAVTVNNATGEGSQLVDMYGTDNVTVVPDIRQNWRLISIQRNSSHVFFTVSRVLNACDEQDLAINNDLVRILWGYTNPGTTTENGSLTFIPEGRIQVYLLDPTVEAPQQNGTVQSWRIARTFQIPPQRTSYWCTIHRGITVSRKHHIVGFAPYFKDDASQRHVHHKLVYRCLVPSGLDGERIFGRFVGHPGEECYMEDNHQLPSVFCTEIMMVWAVGGKPFYLPTDVGLALGESSTEFFMLESHYDNPESRSDLVVENGLRTLGGLFQVPPNSNNFTVAGHCSPECTRGMVPPSGMQMVAAMLHAHMTSRKITVKHYRGNRELPWMQNDANYDFDFQQMRLFPEPPTILPGDQVSIECVMDTTSRNATTASGFATTDEMCMAFTVLNKRLPFTHCTSEYPTDRTMARYGITNMTWTKEGQERIVNAATNPQFAGLPFTRVVDQSVGTWTPQRIRELEREQLYYKKLDSTCPPLRDILTIGHALEIIDGATGGLIPTGNIVDKFRATTRSIRTPLIPGLRTARYPFGSTVYSPPPPTCNA